MTKKYCWLCPRCQNLKDETPHETKIQKAISLYYNDNTQMKELNELLNNGWKVVIMERFGGTVSDMLVIIEK